MNRSEFVFKAIDVLGYLPQNSEKFSGITSVKDIKYSNKGNGSLTSGDLYFKTDFIGDGKKRPVIVYIHGGGFIKGDKNYRVSISEYYASLGYYVFCIDHRMPPEAPFPENIADCVDALNFLPTLSEKFPLDLDNIVLTGDSSGGYMCAYLAALKFNEGLSEKISCPEVRVNIKGLMLMCGIYDVDVLMSGKKMFGVIPQTASMLLGFELKSDFSNLAEYKYAKYVSPSEFVNENWCPSFIAWADDDIVCIGQGEPMAKRLEKACPYCETYHCKGMINNHCFHLMPKYNKYARECLKASADYLGRLFS